MVLRTRSAYGQVSAIDATNRIPAVNMKLQNQRDKNQRKDKTGTRTWQGLPAGMRRHTTFRRDVIHEGLAGSDNIATARAADRRGDGCAGRLWAGATVGTGTHAHPSIYFVSPHGLTPGQAVVSEAKFVLWRRW